jgi:hypothetical protein
LVPGLFVIQFLVFWGFGFWLLVIVNVIWDLVSFGFLVFGIWVLVLGFFGVGIWFLE